jgi:hypothetical protein
MKRSLLLALIVALHLSSWAQDEPSRWSVGLNGGAAIPVGGFAHFRGVRTGTALPGAGLEVFTAYRFTPRWSGVLAVSGQQNKGDGIPTYNGLPMVGDNISSNNRDWRTIRIQAGPVYSLPLDHNRRVSLQVRVLAGIQETWAPQSYTFLVSNMGNIDYGQIYYSNARFPLSFSYEAGAGLQWRLSKRVALTASGSYAGSRPTKAFDFITYLVPSGPITAVYPTSTIHGNAGLVYFFPYSKNISVAP